MTRSCKGPIVQAPASLGTTKGAVPQPEKKMADRGVFTGKQAILDSYCATYVTKTKNKTALSLVNICDSRYLSLCYDIELRLMLIRTFVSR